jgi:hypothetical protein
MLNCRPVPETKAVGLSDGMRLPTRALRQVPFGSLTTKVPPRAEKATRASSRGLNFGVRLMNWVLGSVEYRLMEKGYRQVVE